MPKIVVNEQDLSWYYRRRAPGQITVLMPGVATWGPHEPVLVNDENFIRMLGTDSVDPDDISYHMAASFVQSGLNVLFWRICFDSTGEKTAKFTTSTAAKQLAKADESSLLNVIVSAKYPGSFGNKLTVTSKGSGSLRTFVVYNGNSVLESLTCDFDNINSQFYYKEINRTSSYIEVTPDNYEVTVNGKVVTRNNVSGTNFTRIKLEDGSDGTYTTEKVVEGIKADMDDKFGNYREFFDPLVYDFSIIVNGGYNDIEATGEEGKEYNSISTIDEKFTRLAAKRGNSIYLVDGLKSMSAEAFYSYCGLPRDDPGSEDIFTFNTSYAAAYGPWCSAQLVSNGVVRELPGSYLLLISWGQSVAKGNPIWYAPAGVKRASLGNLVRETMYPVGSAVIDMWQNQDFINNEQVSVSEVYKVNPIANLKQYGYVIYGNSTLLHNRYDGATSMLQLFSVRVLANLIKSRAFDVSLALNFDQIDDDLFAEFKSLMTVFMEQLRYGKALYDYQIVVDRSHMTLDNLNGKIVPVTIRISPNPAAENFIINLEISQAGITFDDDTDNVYSTNVVEVVDK